MLKEKHMQTNREEDNDPEHTVIGGKLKVLDEPSPLTDLNPVQHAFNLLKKTEQRNPAKHTTTSCIKSLERHNQ